MLDINVVPFCWGVNGGGHASYERPTGHGFCRPRVGPLGADKLAARAKSVRPLRSRGQDAAFLVVDGKQAPSEEPAEVPGGTPGRSFDTIV